MVCDKIQVRSIGPIDQVTRQPVKGRKFGGGIRIGEMERDSLLAHGAAYILYDRLYVSSDYCILDCCMCCGSILSLQTINICSYNQIDNLCFRYYELVAFFLREDPIGKTSLQVKCHQCNKYDMVEKIATPFVF